MIPLLKACTDDDAKASSGDCVETPSETEDRFQQSLLRILWSQTFVLIAPGIEMTVNITIQNQNENCALLADAIVDIWHCDKDGYYSEYGGTGMQQENFQSVHFLRGRQTTNADGVGSFQNNFSGMVQRQSATHSRTYL